MKSGLPLVLLLLVHDTVNGRSTIRVNRHEDGHLEDANTAFFNQFVPLYDRNIDDSVRPIYKVGIAYQAEDSGKLFNTRVDDRNYDYLNDYHEGRNIFMKKINSHILEDQGLGYDEIAQADYSEAYLDMLNSTFINPYELKIPSNMQILPMHYQNSVNTDRAKANNDNIIEKDSDELLLARFKREVAFPAGISETRHSGQKYESNGGIVMKDHADCGRKRERRPDSGSGNNGSDDGNADAGGGDTDGVGGAVEDPGNPAAEQLKLSNSRANNRRKNTSRT